MEEEWEWKVEEVEEVGVRGEGKMVEGGGGGSERGREDGGGWRKGRGTGWVVVEGDKTAKGKEGWGKVGREWSKEGGGG